MIAIDTNVLVRVLADDPEQPEQVAAARALVTDAGQVYVSTVAQVETVWVLESGYDLPKATIIAVLEHLETNQAFEQEAPERCQHALDLFRDSNVDYSDCLILAGCQALDLSLHTFDKRLSKLDGVVRVAAE